MYTEYGSKHCGSTVVSDETHTKVTVKYTKQLATILLPIEYNNGLLPVYKKREISQRVMCGRGSRARAIQYADSYTDLYLW